MPDGILVLDKPSGPTSHDMVNLVRRGSGEKRVGHAGTLDPLATGVLVICLGAMTRLSEYLIGEDKRYRATVRLGESTTTYDAQGDVTATAPVNVTREAFEAALAGFRGEIWQRPPAYSAIKRGGKKAYEQARRGQAMVLEPRAVTIHSLTLAGWQPPEAVIEAHCSAGTYIRSLAHDLGQALGCGAHLRALRRTAAGHFEAGEAVTVEALEAGFGDGSWRQHLRPAQAALAHWPIVQVGQADAARLKHGNPIEAGPDAGEAAPSRPALAYGPEGRLVAVVEREAGGAWRPRKVFGGG